MEYFDQFGIDIGYVVIGMAGIILLLFIIILVMLIRDHGLRKRYKQFMSGENGKSMESAILDKFQAIDQLQSDVVNINKELNRINGQLVTAYQKIGIVKYDAFKEIGGKLSFVLVLLTAEDNGFILNSMHSTKEGCYTYTKEVINGEVSVILSEEEQRALNEAKQNMGLKNVGE